MKKEPKIEVKTESTPVQTIPVKTRKTRTVNPEIKRIRDNAKAEEIKIKSRIKARAYVDKLSNDQLAILLEAINEKGEVSNEGNQNLTPVSPANE
jgi:hypothetical protein